MVLFTTRVASVYRTLWWADGARGTFPFAGSPWKTAPGDAVRRGVRRLGSRRPSSNLSSMALDHVDRFKISAVNKFQTEKWNCDLSVHEKISTCHGCHWSHSLMTDFATYEMCFRTLLNVGHRIALCLLWPWVRSTGFELYKRSFIIASHRFRKCWFASVFRFWHLRSCCVHGCFTHCILFDQNVVSLSR